MMKRLMFSAVALFLAAGMSLAGGKSKAAKEKAYTGWITDTHCGAKGASADHAACLKKCIDSGTAKYALYTSSDKKLYVLDPQEKAAENAAQHVKVMGTVEGDTLHVTSITMAAGKAEKPKKAAKSKT